MQQQQTQYQANQFDFLLLLNIPVPIHSEYGEILNIKTPSIFEYYTNTSFRKLEALLLMDIEESVVGSPESFGFIAESYSDILIGLVISEVEKDIIKEFENISGCLVEKTGISFNGVEITETDLLEIRAVLLLATGNLEREDTTKEEDEFEKRMREMEERINKIKGETNEAGETYSFKEMILHILYEIGSSAEEIKNLNMYGIKEMYKLSSLATADKIKKIAAGNGNLGEKNPYKGILSD